MAANRPTEWVFGYGSLVDTAALAAWLGRGAFGPGETALCRLRGWRRAWNIARDNAMIAAGRPHYVDARSGARAALFVTVLNIRPAAGEAVNGLAFRVSRAERELLDRREFNYDRIDATGFLDREPGQSHLGAYGGIYEPITDQIGENRGGFTSTFNFRSPSGRTKFQMRLP